VKLSPKEQAAAIADVRDRLANDEQWRCGFPPDAHRYLRKRSWKNDERVTEAREYTPC
jgi:hypothetical protein